MALQSKILTVTKPSILIDGMSMLDTRDSKSPIKSTTNQHKIAGAVYPLIQINKYQFDPQEVSGFMLDETGFLPKIRVSVYSHNGVFLSKYFPKDGDPMSVWIRSKMDEFKPIRCDFEITSINALPSIEANGDAQSFTIEGVLRVPGLYAEWCKTFGDKTSYDTLIDLSKELKLGFASNEVSTADKQKWICAFDNYEKFIKDITGSAYKDDNSFFETFIDKHYNLNFVNINNQFSEEFDIDKALVQMAMNDDFHNTNENQNFSTDLYLCNHKGFKASGNFIKGYTLLNNAGQIIMDNGYRRILQNYEDALHNDKPEDNYKSYFIEPVDTANLGNDKVLLKGREGEDFYKIHNKYKYVGIQSTNTHSNYSHAIIQNWQNRQQIDKMIMRVYLGFNNFNLYRGQRIPVVIINDGNTARQKATASGEQSSEDKISYDKFLSGYYFISGITYTWDSEVPIFRQELFLNRREWPKTN